MTINKDWVNTTKFITDKEGNQHLIIDQYILDNLSETLAMFHSVTSKVIDLGEMLKITSKELAISNEVVARLTDIIKSKDTVIEELNSRIVSLEDTINSSISTGESVPIEEPEELPNSNPNITISDKVEPVDVKEYDYFKYVD